MSAAAVNLKLTATEFDVLRQVLKERRLELHRFIGDTTNKDSKAKQEARKLAGQIDDLLRGF